MKKTILIFTIIFSNLAFSQSKFDSIPNIQNNFIWLEKLEKISKKQDQIKFIIEKIKSDSIYKNSEIKIESYVPENGHISDKIESDNCKIKFALSENKKLYVLDLNQNPSYTNILKYLNEETIKEVKILEGMSATALFGRNGNCGVVWLIANKKLKRVVK